MSTPSNAIIVGVSAEGSAAALEFAVEEAKRTSRPIHLVHVLMLPAGAAYADIYGNVQTDAEATLAEALAHPHA